MKWRVVQYNKLAHFNVHELVTSYDILCTFLYRTNLYTSHVFFYLFHVTLISVNHFMLTAHIHVRTGFISTLNSCYTKFFDFRVIKGFRQVPQKETTARNMFIWGKHSRSRSIFFTKYGKIDVRRSSGLKCQRIRHSWAHYKQIILINGYSCFSDRDKHNLTFRDVRKKPVLITCCNSISDIYVQGVFGKPYTQLGPISLPSAVHHSVLSYKNWGFHSTKLNILQYVHKFHLYKFRCAFILRNYCFQLRTWLQIHKRISVLLQQSTDALYYPFWHTFISA
jgi:hypothetical protein